MITAATKTTKAIKARRRLRRVGTGMTKYRLPLRQVDLIQRRCNKANTFNKRLPPVASAEYVLCLVVFLHTLTATPEDSFSVIVP